MGKYSKQVPFTLLADGKPRWGSLSAGAGLECVALLLLVWIPVLMPQKLEVARKYWITPLATPHVSVWKPQPVKIEKPAPVKQPEVARVQPKPEELIDPPKPKIISPVFSSPIAKPSTARRNSPKPEMPELARANPALQANAMGSSAIPTLKRPREAVQTGGFGDPNGVPATGRTDKAANIAKLGAYDLPPGPGYGNGTGGARGARGVVASAGFGNGVAIGGNGGQGGGGRAVQQGVFADQRPAAEAPKAHAAAATPRQEPVEILFKPKPVYTDEARRHRVEGEVLLQVVFTATGELRVLRVVQGLGYGLEEAAVSAARQIRFRPARADGQPVDSTATVHIVFELAY